LIVEALTISGRDRFERQGRLAKGNRMLPEDTGPAVVLILATASFCTSGVTDLTRFPPCAILSVKVEGKCLSGRHTSPPGFTKPGGVLLVTVAGPPSPTDYEGKEECT